MTGAGVHPYHPQWTTGAAAPTPPAMQPPGAPPPAPSAAAAVAPVPHHSPILPPEEVRTIFISGLPDDVKERELQNMLWWLPGY